LDSGETQPWLVLDEISYLRLGAHIYFVLSFGCSHSQAHPASLASDQTITSACGQTELYRCTLHNRKVVALTMSFAGQDTRA